MLAPKKTKYRKAFKGRIHGLATSANSLAYGVFGLKSLDPERLTARQIEAARRAAVRYLKRVGKFWIRIFPDIPVTSKPAEVRMGSGKGSPDHFVVRVKPGRVLFELDGVGEDVARVAFDKAAAKLPVRTKFVKSDAID
jgi:large subunit ribosomal protein L16